jgi:hypothetical protein
MKRQPMNQLALIDTTEYSPLFSGMAVQVSDEQPAPARVDPSGPVASWGWQGTLEPITYRTNWEVRGAIESQWKWLMPDADRSRAGFAKFYRAGLIHAGFDPFPATYDEDGNCYLCGECGRCPGWHYAEEATR